MRGRAVWIIPPLAAILVNLLPLASFFNSDDFGLLRAVRDRGPFGIWSGQGEPFFRPLVSASVWMDSKIWGLEPFGYHLTNVLLHALNSLLVGVLTWRCVSLASERRAETGIADIPVGPKAAGIVAGLLFAVLSCHAEAVAWISGRTDVLSTAFALAAAVVFLSDRSWRLAGSAVLFALSLCCKESPLLLPIFLALVAWAVRRKRWASQALAGLAIVAFYIPIRGAVIGQAFGGYGAGSYFGAGIPGLVKNAAIYAGKMVAPGSAQMMDRLLPTPLGEKSILIFAALFALLAGFALMLGVRSRGWLSAAALCGFFLLVLPALPLGMNPYTAEGSRFLYLPSAAVCLTFALLFSARRGWLAVPGVLGVLFAGALCQQNQAWHDAGEDAHKSLNALRDLPNKAVLLSVPDSYRGAYVLRNCLDDGLALFGQERAKIPVLSAYSYDESGFSPTLEAQGEVVRIAVPGTYGSLLSLQPGTAPGDGPSAIVRFSPSALIAQSSNGFVLTPGGLLVPPR